MSARELSRVEVLSRVKAGTLSLGSAATLMAVSYRQAKRLARRFVAEGAKGLKHRRAGGVSNHARPSQERERVVALVRLETLVGEHRARFVDRLQLQVPTAHRAGRVLQAHEHARAGFARRRAARFADLDQHRAAAGELPAGGHCTQA